MKIDVRNGNIQKQTVYLKPEAILKYFLETDENIDTLIKCKGSEVNMITTDYEFYEALGSLKEYDNFKLNKLVKFFEAVDVISYRKNTGREKPILTHERVEELRKISLKQDSKESESEK